MQSRCIDAYFYMATKGDKRAYENLYSDFVKRAKKVIRTVCHISTKFSGIPEDFSDLIDKYFFQILNEYDSERGSFSNFVDYILTKRFFYNVQTLFIERMNNSFSLDDEFDGSKSIELVEDPSQTSIQSDIMLNNFKQRIASSNRYRTQEERTQNKILMLQYAGYSNYEIAKQLKMTIGELRGFLKKIRSDNDIVNLKLELK